MHIFTKIKEAGKWVLVFVILKVLISIVERLLLYIFNPDISWFDILLDLKSLLFQSLSFLIITLLTAKWINKKYYYFIFPSILFLVSNFLFLFHLYMEENKVFFSASFCSFAVDYFCYNANIISDILMQIHLLSGIFDGGIFFTESIIYFYVLYAGTPFIYYLGLTYLCNYIVKKKFKRL